MTKPYHLTQEQAAEIRRNTADPHQRIMHQPKTSFLVSEEWLQAFANAALDRVLGEQWISVEDRLPEHTLYSDTPLDDGWGKPIPPLYKSERVLSLDEYGTVYIGKLDIMEGKVIPKITHWMPLTKLYAPKGLTCPPHKWDKSGEKCLVCGDKDWMG